jgi:DNA-directed RNA polymerase subunit RPC12/RpoP
VPKTEAHSYKTLISLGAETHKGVCACGEESEPVAHTWGRATIIKQPTHTECGLQTSTCACGEIKVETVAPKANDHKYGEWTSYGDANQHKKACECGDVVYASHAWGNGEVTTEATHMAEGVRTYTCADCGQIKTEAIPMTPDHKCETWTSVDGAQHQAACVECGLTVYADHAWNEGEVITAQTHVTSGEMKYTCEDCGAEKIEVILAGHAYGEWEKNDASQHKASCSCGHVIYEAHDWDEGMVTREATHTVYGEKTYTCAVCGQTKTDRIEKTTEHTFSDVWVEHDATQHKKVCACGEAEYAEHSYDWVEHDD